MTEKMSLFYKSTNAKTLEMSLPHALKSNSEIHFLLPVMVLNAYIPSTREIEIGGLRVQDQPPLHSEFKTNLPTY